MAQISTAADFKKLSRKNITLPSGLNVVIRKLALRDFLDVGEIPLPANEQETREERLERVKQAVEKDPRKIARYGEAIIVKGVVRPRFSTNDEDFEREDTVLVADLSQDDYTALVVEIMKFSGVHKEAGRLAESFRADPEQPAAGSPGATVREIADGAPAPNAG